MRKGWWYYIFSFSFVFFTLCLGYEYRPLSGNIKHNKSELKESGLQTSFFALPLLFVENKGQYDKPVRYYERGQGHTTFFTVDGVYISLSRTGNKKTEDENEGKRLTGNGKKERDGVNPLTDFVVIRPVNGRPDEILAEEEIAGKVNYFIGNDPSGWITDIPAYRKVRYREVYRNTDILFYGNQRNLEYDIVLRPGADLNEVAIRIENARDLKMNENGDIEIYLSGGLIIQKRPDIYQEINGVRVDISGNYVIRKDKEGFLLGFDIKEFKREYALVIDPVLNYSTYIGGSGGDTGLRIALDTSNNVYITGYTSSSNFPLKNAYQPSKALATDIFITKLDSTGSNLVYSTFLGGGSEDEAWGIKVDSSGNVYITGKTDSNDFPVLGAYKSSIGGSYDAFVTKLSSGGNSLVYSTYIGGSNEDYGADIAVDNTGAVYVTGSTKSPNFPVKNAYDSTCGADGSNNCNYNSGVYYPDAFLLRLNTEGNDLIYSTFLGGSSEDYSRRVAIDGSGNAYIAGYTNSSNFPVSNAYQGSKKGNNDIFVAKIGPNGDTLIYSTYLGGSGSEEFGNISLDASGNLYVTGRTYSSDFPVKNAYKSIFSGNSDVFITKLNSSGNDILYSTYFGGSGDDGSYGIVADSADNVYITGTTSSANFPLKNLFQGSLKGAVDAFITKLNCVSNNLVFSTYLGGSNLDYATDIAVDSSKNIYVVGYTVSTDFPVVSAYQTGNAGGTDVFVTKVAAIYSLVVNKSGITDNVISSNPAGIDCGADCVGEYDTGTVVTLTASINEGSVFGGWGGDCASCGTNKTCQVTMNNDKNCTAAFNPIQRTLTVYKAGTGYGTVNTGTTCTLSWNGLVGTCTVNYGTVISLSGVANTGSTFVGWSNGDGSAQSCSGTADCAFNINYDSSVTATFNINKYLITVSAFGTGSGVIDSDPTGISFSYPQNNTFSRYYIYGTNLILYANADLGSTVSFNGSCLASGGNETGNGTGSAVCTFNNLDEDKTIKPVFARNIYTITTSAVPPEGGTVNCSPNPVEHGNQSVCNIDINPGYILSYVSGSCGGNLSGKVYTTNQITSSCTVEAHFDTAEPYQLSIIKTGTGSGLVTSEDLLINCGDSCDAKFEAMKTVKLHAEADEGSVFTVWKRDCSICGSNVDCNITISRDMICEAIFGRESNTDAGVDTAEDVSVEDALEDTSTADIVSDTSDIVVDATEDILSDGVSDVMSDTSLTDAINDVFADIKTNDTVYIDSFDVEKDAGGKGSTEEDIYACSCSLLE